MVEESYPMSERGCCNTPVGEGEHEPLCWTRLIGFVDRDQAPRALYLTATEVEALESLAILYAGGHPSDMDWLRNLIARAKS